MMVTTGHMKRSTVLKTILSVSGLIAAGVGGTILFAPAAFYASNGIDLGGDISLLNETRSAGGALLASGIAVMSGVFVARLIFTSAVISILIYLSYGMSRILSITIDGMPTEQLAMATVVELLIGLASVLALLRYRENE
jgi:hypothetical protein